MRHTNTITILALLLLSSFGCFAQFTDNFSDGNYSANPVWTPSGATDWIVNSDGQLQSNNTTTGTSFYISTPNTLATTAEWQFWDSIAFNPSSANYIDVFLTTSASDITLASTTGYFVRIGNTNDEICLYRKDAGGTVTKIIDGADGILNTSNSQARIKVVRDASNQWTLFRDLSGTGNSYTSEGSVTDATYTSSAFFAIYIKQSTSSFVQKHFFDDVIAKPYVPDITPPSIVSIIAQTATGLDVLFSEPVELITSQQAGNYTISTMGSPVTANRDAANNALVHLAFGSSFPNGTLLSLTVNGVKDFAGNALTNGSTTFSYYTPQQYDVVIDEIMADPTPQVGLPDAEWLELKNTSAFPINLSGWRVGKGTSVSGPMPAYTLKPDSFVVVCTGSSVPFLSVYAPTISVTSFITLNNTGDLIYLLSPTGKTVHAVNYSDAWYNDPGKKDGGYTLEMIDTKNPCAGASNWTASNDLSGGTPGRKNSVTGLNGDNTPPAIASVTIVNSTTLSVAFSEPIDSASVVSAANYTVTGGTTVQSVSATGPIYQNITINLSSPLVPGTNYTLTVTGAKDCVGNIIGSSNSVVFSIVLPTITSAIPLSSTNVDVLFNKEVDAVTAQALSNYIVDNSVGSPVAAAKSSSNPSLVHLLFAAPLPAGTTLTLTVDGVKDLLGNTVSNGTATFIYYKPKLYDVVIDEIMADPTPMQGLPDIEWIELKNTSSFPVNLAGWKLLKGTTFTGAMPAYILNPDSFVVICSSGSQPFMSSFGSAISVSSFPAINNTGDLISIVGPEGNTIHSINYSDDWYGNPVKKDGGWTLEMIDTKNPCSGAENWTASNDKLGGTPARKNSVDGTNPDHTIPKLVRAYPRTGSSVVAVFDALMDSTSVTTIGNYTVSDGLMITSASAIAPSFSRVILTLSSQLDSNKIYTLSASDVVGCSGNKMEAGTVSFGIPSYPDTTDIVINEILFNPKPGGADYVELYNNSRKIINLNQLMICNRNSQGLIDVKYRISNDTILLFPSGYALLTTDPGAVMHDYVSELKSFVPMNSMPSFNNDKGSVVLENANNGIVDEVDYSEKWHFPLLNDDEGVSLERLSFAGKSDQSNFHSAASSVGYGTPGYKNSQYTADKEVAGEITLDPPVFSPDNDGHDDVLTINYEFPTPGYVTNITIYNSAGRAIRFLEKNALCGNKGYFRWDGLDEQQQKLPVGIYIVVAECMNTEAKKKTSRLAVVLARKM